MKTYLKLVHFEIHRFRHFLFGLMAVTALVQLGGTLFYAFDMRNYYMGRKFGSIGGAASGDLTSFAEALSTLIELPVLLCIAALILYVFLIWYRDWSGRGTFIYRLLMLPSARGQLYAAKLTAILLFVFSLLAWQLVLLAVLHALFNAIVPDEYLMPVALRDLIEASVVFDLLFPYTFERFVLYYGMGATGLTVAFTAILIERSISRVGLVVALLYAGGAAAFLVFAVICHQTSLFPQVYDHEMILLATGAWVLTAAFSVWLGLRLLNRKISV